MDVFPGPQPCVNGCKGNIEPMTVDQHNAWHTQQDSLIFSLRSRLLGLGINL